MVNHLKKTQLAQTCVKFPTLLIENDQTISGSITSDYELFSNIFKLIIDIKYNI